MHFTRASRLVMLAAAALCALCAQAAAAAAAAAPPPPQAAAVGYTQNTFGSTFAAADIDSADQRTRQFKWYVGQFFGWKSTPAPDLESSPAGPLVIKNGHNSEVATAAPVKTPKKWTGTAFGGGGYFEAELKFDPPAGANENWPSFWGMAVEHMAGLPAEQWSGQAPGYAHFIEVDFMEYLFGKNEPANLYAGNMHDWYGQFRKSCPGAVFCKQSLPYAEVKRATPVGTRFNEYHKYGWLWVPAMQNADGWAQFYFDDKPMGPKVSWKRFTAQEPSDARQPWTFGILDQQHLVVMVGTGKNQRLTVRSVQVWQKSAAGNLSQ